MNLTRYISVCQAEQPRGLMRYVYLLNILDGVIREAPERYSRKYPRAPSAPEEQNQARARAMIHLYLKVMFGLTDFEEREKYVTDGGYDGGIDAYYIDRATRTLYVVQSKFRTTEVNFESKEITLEELLQMDVDRILGGQSTDESGNEYAGKIKQLQREVGEVEDIARYRYVVVILANLPNPPRQKLQQLVGGYPIDIIDSERTYRELVFPVLSGTYFTASDITLPIDLSNKNAGSKISYEVATKYADCQITVLFVPAIEIARIMHTYKNAVLKFNPRSYLEHEGQSVNNAIRQTVLSSETNELALYNNGITMLSEETSINERIGQHSKAQLYVKNPQIINGGQTSFTLSRIYSDPEVDAEAVFGNKEIMLKVITVSDCAPEDKGRLIDEISSATNRQTPVFNADRFSNDSFHKAVQQIVFERYGALYERKRGEFADGVRDGYIDKNSIVERNSFWRIYYAANGDLKRANQKRLFQLNPFEVDMLSDMEAFEKWSMGYAVYAQIFKNRGANRRFEKYHYGMIHAFVALTELSTVLDPLTIKQVIFEEGGFWKRFEMEVRERFQTNPETFPNGVTRKGGQDFSFTRYFKQPMFETDLKDALARELETRASFAS
ncbi:AIPR family protein [Xanthomonas sp. LF07-6]|uniref:AIPR family protein n=1 Tax=Xanthomonas sp. LF07-6 TaxID=3097550 RepID=UPI002A8169ED|nr:AIPR family protein [Xanthomonas sp. LF07-6]MDY4339520.1 AIPR family protein [Xanthomonas sp. LF07-6]